MLAESSMNQGGGGLVYLTPAGTASFAPSAGIEGFELVVLSETASFSALTAAAGYTGLAALVGKSLPRGSYRIPLSAATISVGEAIIMHS